MKCKTRILEYMWKKYLKILKKQEKDFLRVLWGGNKQPQIDLTNIKAKELENFIHNICYTEKTKDLKINDIIFVFETGEYGYLQFRDLICDHLSDENFTIQPKRKPIYNPNGKGFLCFIDLDDTNKRQYTNFLMSSECTIKVEISEDIASMILKFKGMKRKPFLKSSNKI